VQFLERFQISPVMKIAYWKKSSIRCSFFRGEGTKKNKKCLPPRKIRSSEDRLIKGLGNDKWKFQKKKAVGFRLFLCFLSISPLITNMFINWLFEVECLREQNGLYLRGGGSKPKGELLAPGFLMMTGATNRPYWRSNISSKVEN